MGDGWRRPAQCRDLRVDHCAKRAPALRGHARTQRLESYAAVKKLLDAGRDGERLSRPVFLCDAIRFQTSDLLWLLACDRLHSIERRSSAGLSRGTTENRFS